MLVARAIPSCCESCWYTGFAIVLVVARIVAGWRLSSLFKSAICCLRLITVGCESVNCSCALPSWILSCESCERSCGITGFCATLEPPPAIDFIPASCEDSELICASDCCFSSWIALIFASMFAAALSVVVVCVLRSAMLCDVS